MGFMDTFRRFGLGGITPLNGLIELSKCCGWWAPYQNAAILQHRHCELHQNAQGRLHKDGGMAVKYRDGWGVYALNGVRVPQWLAETSAEQLDCKQIVQLQNVEERREGVRKVGVERLVYKLGAKSLDKRGDYELLEMNLGLQRPAHALKMLNASVPELWHVEFVQHHCRTVEQALNFRNHLKPELIDDEKGADWFQQGDCLMFPKGAKKFKSRPALLT